MKKINIRRVRCTAPPHAFTIIELLMVIAIMVVLFAITAPAIAPLTKNRALRTGAMQMRAAIMRARTMAIANSIYQVPLIPITIMKDGYEQYMIPGGEFEVWIDESSGVTVSNNGNTAGGTDWVYGGVSGQCHTETGAAEYELAIASTTINPEDVFSVWAYLDNSVTYVGFGISEASYSMVYWGSGTGGTDMGDLPEKGKWVQLATSFGTLGLTSEDSAFTKVRFKSLGGQIWWDMALIWRGPYMLPENIAPDPTMVQYPIEFENDGRLKPTHGGYWSDRMIILRDMQFGESSDGDAYGFWRCEPFTDDDDNGFWDTGESYDDWGLDRISGTSDTGDTDSSWSKDGSVTELPEGQMYIKINKITGHAKVCAHPGE